MVGLMNWQQTLDKICHSVGPLNYLETVINFVMTLCHYEKENVMTPCFQSQHWKYGVPFNCKNSKLYRFKHENQFGNTNICI